MTYKEFLENKIDIAPLSGIDVDEKEINSALKPHQRVSVLWALRGGRRGIFGHLTNRVESTRISRCEQKFINMERGR